MAAMTASARIVTLVPAGHPSKALAAESRATFTGTPLKCQRLAAARSRLVMSADNKEQSLIAPTAVALLAAAVIPEIAEAAQPGVSPSLKNFLLSVVAGGVVFAGLSTAVLGVATFDPVKRKG